MEMEDRPTEPEISMELIRDLGLGVESARERAEEVLAAPTQPIISFNHVSMWFGERKVLDDVSFTVKRGQTLCILGRSGVGKSVALRILMGFLHPQVGSIRVEGEEINGLT